MKVQRNDIINTQYLYRDVFKSKLVEGAEFVGKYEFPQLKSSKTVPTRAIPFDKASITKDKEQWVHFFTDDYRFERIWNRAQDYIECLRKYQGVITPDFSLYRDMPLAMQIWNTYRNRAVAFWLQSNGIEIIPNVQWGDERTYDFCFDGIEGDGTVAISTNGCIRDKLDRYYFKKGLQVMTDKLTPKTIVNYSCVPDDIFLPYKNAGIQIVCIENFNATVRKKGV